MINIDDLTDPAWNEPFISFVQNGNSFKLDTARRKGDWVSFPSLDVALQQRAQIEANLIRYQDLINAGGKEAIMAKAYKEIGLRRQAIYDRVYIPGLSPIAKPVKEAANHKPIEPASVSDRGQFSMF